MQFQELDTAHERVQKSNHKNHFMLPGKRWDANGIFAQVCICGILRARIGVTSVGSKRESIPRSQLEGEDTWLRVVLCAFEY